MFKIELTLKPRPRWQGLEALDQRRLWGLPDGVHLFMPSGNLYVPHTQEVGEDFARAYFEHDDVVVAEEVSFSMLMKGDVEAKGDEVRWRHEGISAQRAIDLWLAAKMCRMDSDLHEALVSLEEYQTGKRPVITPDLHEAYDRVVVTARQLYDANRGGQGGERVLHLYSQLGSNLEDLQRATAS